jgi:uncharacterized coiled-coil DUF342 family protein
MAKKQIVTEKVERSLPCAFDEDDLALKGCWREYLKAQQEAFPIHQKIRKLKEEAEPYEKQMKKALGEIDKGTTEKIVCTKVIDENTNAVTITRDDTGEVVEIREINDEDLQTHSGV